MRVVPVRPPVALGHCLFGGAEQQPCDCSEFSACLASILTRNGDCSSCGHKRAWHRAVDGRLSSSGVASERNLRASPPTSLVITTKRKYEKEEEKEPEEESDEEEEEPETSKKKQKTDPQADSRPLPRLDEHLSPIAQRFKGSLLSRLLPALTCPLALQRTLNFLDFRLRFAMEM